MRYQWPKESVDYLINNYGKLEVKELAKHFGVSSTAIVNKANKLGLNRKKLTGEFWNKREDELLAKHFQFAPKNYLMKLFPTRTWTSIYQRGRKTLNLFRESQDKYSVNYNFFKEWNEHSSYVFGLLLADGWLRLDGEKKNDTRIEIQLKTEDREILEKIRTLMELENTIKDSKRGSSSLIIANRKLALDLVDKGFAKTNKTQTESWPINLPENMSRHLIRGLLDGDGTIYDDTGIRLGFLGTYSILKEMMKHIPVDTTSNSILPRGYKNKESIYGVHFRKEKSKAILDWLYKDATVFLDRKYKRYLELK